MICRTTRRPLDRPPPAPVAESRGRNAGSRASPGSRFRISDRSVPRRRRLRRGGRGPDFAGGLDRRVVGTRPAERAGVGRGRGRGKGGQVRRLVARGRPGEGLGLGRPGADVDQRPVELVGPGDDQLVADVQACRGRGRCPCSPPRGPSRTAPTRSRAARSTGRFRRSRTVWMNGLSAGDRPAIGDRHQPAAEGLIGVDDGRELLHLGVDQDQPRVPEVALGEEHIDVLGPGVLEGEAGDLDGGLEGLQLLLLDGRCCW